jgi:uncharacterized membrane protein required for colicin V production
MPIILKQIGWLDGLALAAIAFLVIRGFVLGCSGELGRLVAILSAAAVGFFGFAPVSRLVFSASLFGANVYAGRLVVFILLLVVCVALWLGLRRLLSEGIRLVVDQPFDSILGGIIGGIKAFVLVAVMCAFGLLNPNSAERTRLQEKSFAAQKLSPLLNKITSPDK